MSDLQQAAQQALNALLMMLESYAQESCSACDHADAAVYALRTALAEPGSCDEQDTYAGKQLTKNFFKNTTPPKKYTCVFEKGVL